MSKYDQIKLGDTSEFTREVTAQMVEDYARLVGDTNPVHLDEEYAAKSFFRKRVAHGLLVGGFISTVLGTQMPGPGSIYLSQAFEFKKAVFLGEVLTASVEAVEKEDKHKKIKFRTWIENQDGQLVLDGHAMVLCR